jgi:ATP-dependent RNA helicase RhlE
MSFRHASRYGKRSHRSYGGYGRSQGSKRKVKSFDPSMFVQKAVDTEPIDYEATHKFADFALSKSLKENIERKGYVTPTPIQDQAIPVILEGRDLVGIANTGTGKTAAFLIPLIQKVLSNPQERILIITPTRELADQILSEAREFTLNLGVYSTICIGGVSLNRQMQQLKRNPHLVIGTPGRLKDLYERRAIHFDRYNTIVLDEVDQMLDMGFIHDMKFIIGRLGQNRQSLFFSATSSQQAEIVMHSFLSDPVYISVKASDSIVNIEQDVIKMAGRSKEEVLHELLITEGFTKVLVFAGTKHMLNKLEKNLKSRGHNVAAIHGNKSQNQRQRVLNQFKDNNLQALLATDVASRGLDIDNVTHVINYDMPQTYEDYIHRIGRTGRADKTGVALTFIE